MPPAYIEQEVLEALKQRGGDCFWRKASESSWVLSAAVNGVGESRLLARFNSREQMREFLDKHSMKAQEFDPEADAE